MSNPSDFIIENGVLTRYVGPGGDVEIPEGVTSIGNLAFLNCRNLTNVMIPVGVTSIGNLAFSNCSNLINVTIPDGVTSVGGGSFSNCRSLMSVTIPASVISVGAGAFSDCRSLMSVTISENVINIGKEAFKNCNSLTSVYISSIKAWCGIKYENASANPLYYAANLYMNGTLLKDLVIPKGVTSISNWAFFHCGSLTSLTIPEGVTSIGGRAFSGCGNLTSVTIPDSVTSIGPGAFNGCNALADENGLVIVRDILFDCVGSHDELVIPNSVTRISIAAFHRCESLVSVTIPEGVTSIGRSAFEDCISLKHITIPDSVMKIGDCAFKNCCSLTKVNIPAGVTSIGDCAFYGCALRSIIIPESVTSISDSAFCFCRSLTNVTIPESVTSIGNKAFYSCHDLTSVTIPKSVTSLGSDAFDACTSLTDVTIQKGVKRIGVRAFERCRSLKSIMIPEGVISICKGAFFECRSLTSVTIPESVTDIGDEAFCECELQIVNAAKPLTSKVTGKGSFCLIIPGETPQYLSYSAKTNQDNLTDFWAGRNWVAYDLELINNGPKYKYPMHVRLFGALGRLLNPVELSEENHAMFIELLNKNAKKLVPLAEMLGDGELIKAIFSLGILDDKNIKAVKKLLAESAIPELAALASMETTAAAKKKTEKKAEPTSPLAKEYAEKLKAIKGDALIKKMKLIGTAFPKVLLQNGSEAPEELFRFLLASYGSQLGGHYHFVPEVDKAAELLRYDSLCEAMDVVSNHLDGPSYPAVIPLLCRFGNASQIRALTEAWKDWIDWSKYSRRGRNACEYLLRALPLSDTREAVVWLEKNGRLWNYLDPANVKGYFDMREVNWEEITGDSEGEVFVKEHYSPESGRSQDSCMVGLYRFAKLRGISLADVYEQYLFDFGFDAEGKKVYDLGVTTVEAYIDRELKLSLYDTVNKKKVRGMPKKGIDPAVQKKAADDLADLRGNIKKAVKIKTDQLFADYLSGKDVPADAWQKSYLNNPLLRNIAELLVWEQDGNCFTLDASGLIDSNGTAYLISEKPIRIAHPMEMKPEDVAAWQKYYTAHNLKQPFQQVWEPVYEQSEIREDRYKDCQINANYLKSQSRRGIHVEWWENYWVESRDFRIQGFEVDVREADREDDKLRLEIVSLRALEWNRRANMVIAFLDRITVWDRVKKDDVRVMDHVSRFTLAQITEMIQIAQEANAVNVLALLLEYKNAHFADFDPMDEFTLEW